METERLCGKALLFLSFKCNETIPCLGAQRIRIVIDAKKKLKKNNFHFPLTIS